ncbi:unnamed protein product [Protopolystoma xenopodis]|uniref:Uncharacterized protein n=1 Tax=Protopolystoma xenopodis TaxID=117903 RepID=A0A3S5AH83_9PLAT|nr:unnamed protein product [Protopolystoma xenopodis]
MPLSSSSITGLRPPACALPQQSCPLPMSGQTLLPVSSSAGLSLSTTSTPTTTPPISISSISTITIPSISPLPPPTSSQAPSSTFAITPQSQPLVAKASHQAPSLASQNGPSELCCPPVIVESSGPPITPAPSISTTSTLTTSTAAPTPVSSSDVPAPVSICASTRFILEPAPDSLASCQRPDATVTQSGLGGTETVAKSLSVSTTAQSTATSSSGIVFTAKSMSDFIYEIDPQLQLDDDVKEVTHFTPIYILYKESTNLSN